jgi:hypothetical protein
MKKKKEKERKLNITAFFIVEKMKPAVTIGN